MCKQQKTQKPDAVGVAVEPEVRLPAFTVDDIDNITNTANSAKKILFKESGFKSICREITPGDVHLVITTILEMYSTNEVKP